MFTLTHKLPKSEEFIIACSGGVDSTACLHFLLSGNRIPQYIYYVDHGTDFSISAKRCVINTLKLLSREFNVDLQSRLITLTDSRFENIVSNKEVQWRNIRYELFETHNLKKLPIITCHTLDDCLEQYIISTLVRRKNYTLVPYNGPSNTIRPFRTWRKLDIYEYTMRKELNWEEDPTNTDTNFLRGHIRTALMPILLKINPGIFSMIESDILKEREFTKIDI